MGTSIKRRKRIGKVLVLLLASGSLLGISPLTATAAPPLNEVDIVDITVTVTGTPECIPVPQDATWLVATSPIMGTFDLDGDTPLTGAFTVALGFMDGFDAIACPGSPSYPPTGDVVASFASDAENGLTLASMTCQGIDPCDAELLSDTTGEIAGAYNVPQTIGIYGATITITWTP
jgi:hypothetical protein